MLNPAISHRNQSLVIPPNLHPIRLVAGKFSYQLSVISHQFFSHLPAPPAILTKRSPCSLAP
ncbi:MAG UNVERIFIED_CONTAM: hypothetical protein LVR29_34075 [Microcystis novacekii LVE1205-3]